MKRWLLCALAVASVAVVADGNLLEHGDFARVNERGIPEGYHASARIPRGGGESLDVTGLLAPDGGGEEGAVCFDLTGELNLNLDLAKPVELEPGRLYRFEVKVKWEELAAVGPGVEPFGPCVLVYVYGASGSHRVAVIKPSRGSEGWVTVQIGIDLGKHPDLREAKVFLRAREVRGRVWFKEAVLEEATTLPEPGTLFTLPSGEVVAAPVLALP